MAGRNRSKSNTSLPQLEWRQYRRNYVTKVWIGEVMSVNFRPNKFYARQGLRVVCEVPVAFARSSSDRMNDPLN